MSRPERAQDLKHHARLHIPFHIVSFATLVVNLVFAIVFCVRHLSVWSAWIAVLSLLIFVPFFLIRIYPLKVQDRVIRLEERLRLHELAPSEWRAHIHQLSEDQLIALRFASDEEVVALAKQALAENLTRKQIKERIGNWRPDHWRV